MGTTALAPAPAQGGLLVLVGLALGAAAVLAAPPAWVLLGPAGAVAVALGVRDLLLRPVLAVGPDALTVVDGVRRLRVPHAQVERVRVVRDRRTPLLELDLGDAGLVVLTRRRLGRSPDEALTLVERVLGVRP